MRGRTPLLNDRQIQIGDLVLREIRLRLEVSVGCGSRLPESGSAGDDAVGR